MCDRACWSLTPYTAINMAPHVVILVYAFIEIYIEKYVKMGTFPTSKRDF